jgi:hypothetical protein
LVVVVSVPRDARLVLSPPPASPPLAEPFSPSLPDVAELSPALEDPSPDSPAAAARVLVPLELDRSFLAQPDPLKWTVGAANVLRIVPSAPHAGQNRGPGASMPWITSVFCRQDAQT